MTTAPDERLAASPLSFEAAREAARVRFGSRRGQFGTQRRDEATVDLSLVPLDDHSDPSPDAQAVRAMTVAHASLAHRAASGDYPLDHLQVAAIWETQVERAVRRIEENKTTDRDGVDPLDAWADTCRRRAAAIRDGGIAEGLTRAQADALAADYQALSNCQPTCEPWARAVLALPAAHRYAQKASARQVEAVAVIADVDPMLAHARIAAFRRDYLDRFAVLSADERPEPPAAWLDGFTQRDFESRDVPRDPATLWAFYRAAADPDAFAPHERLGRPVLSVDLETASPPETTGHDPRQGRIIEFGAVIVDESTGAEAAPVAMLVHPGNDALETYGTGAVHVHHIAPSDVADAPGWQAAAPRVADALLGARLLAQNARFEKSWLAHHLAEAGVSVDGIAFDKDQPAIDTWRIALQHFDLTESGGYKLANICAHVGVAYTDGHRALHDAQVAARAYVAMRRLIHRTWASDPRNARV